MAEFEVFVGLKVDKSQRLYTDVRDEDKGWKLNHNVVDEMIRQKHTEQVVRSAKDQTHREF